MCLGGRCSAVADFCPGLRLTHANACRCQQAYRGQGQDEQEAEGQVVHLFEAQFTLCTVVCAQREFKLLDSR